MTNKLNKKQLIEVFNKMSTQHGAFEVFVKGQDKRELYGPYFCTITVVVKNGLVNILNREDRANEEGHTFTFNRGVTGLNALCYTLSNGTAEVTSISDTWGVDYNKAFGIVSRY
jgi:hypothetical protein